MASENEIVSALMAGLPRAGNTQAVSVAFQDRSAFKPFMDDLYTMLCNVRDRVIENQNTNSASDQRNHNETQKTWKEYIEKSIKAYEERKRENKELLDVQKELADSLKEKDDKLKTYLAYAQRGLNYSFEVMDKHLAAVRRVSDVYLDLESSGVFLVNGFGDLGQVAHNLGMTYEDLAGHLKKTSPLISKLNGTMGDGLKIFDSAINGIDKSLNLSNSEKVSVFESVLSKISPSQLLQMSQAEMNVEVNKAAKELKMLSLATGKSVDLIAQENKQKEQTLRGQAWERAHPEAMRTLRAYGLGDDEEIKEYLMNGGHITSPTLALRISGSEAMQAMLPQMARLAAIGQLNEKSMSQLAERYKYLAAKDLARSEANSRDSKQMMASKASANYELVQFDNRFSESILEKNTKDMEKQYYSDARKSSNKAVGNSQNIYRNIDGIRAFIDDILSGGPEGVSQTTHIANVITSKIKDLTGMIEGKLPKGTLGGLLASVGMESLPYVGKYIGSRITSFFTNRSFSNAVDRFSEAVDRLLNGVSNTTGSIWDSVKDKSRRAWNWITGHRQILARTAAFGGGIGYGAYSIYNDIWNKNYKGLTLKDSMISASGGIATTIISYAIAGLGLSPTIQGFMAGALVGAGIGTITALGRNIYDNWGTGNYNWETVKTAATSIFRDNLLTGAIIGGLLGYKITSSLRGAAMGALLATGAQSLWSLTSETKASWKILSSGDSTPPQTIGGFSTRYFKGAILGGAIGALIGWRHFLIGAALGAGAVGLNDLAQSFVSDWNNIKSSGSTLPQTIGGFSTHYFQGAVVGATIGAIGGLRSAAIGAALGAGAVGLNDLAQSFVSDWNIIKSGDSTPPQTIGGIATRYFKGAVSGATIGALGGLRSAAIGAVLGIGVVGLNELSKIFVDEWNSIKSGKGEFPVENAIFVGAVTGAAIGSKWGVRGALWGTIIGTCGPALYYMGEKIGEFAAKMVIWIDETWREFKKFNLVDYIKDKLKNIVGSARSYLSKIPGFGWLADDEEINKEENKGIFKNENFVTSPFDSKYLIASQNGLNEPAIIGTTPTMKMSEPIIQIQSSVSSPENDVFNYKNTDLYHPSSDMAYNVNSAITNNVDGITQQSAFLKALNQISENTSHTKDVNLNIEALSDIMKDANSILEKVRMDNNLNGNHQSIPNM